MGRTLSAQETESLLVFLDHAFEQRRQALGGVGADNDPVGQLDRYFLLPPVPRLIDPEKHDDLFARAGDVAHIGVRALHVGVIPLDLCPLKALGLGGFGGFIG